MDEVIKELQECFDVVINNYYIHFLKFSIMPEEYIGCYPFEHYESPYLSKKELDEYKEETEVPNGIDLNVGQQRCMLDAIRDNYWDLKQESLEKGKRYTTSNGFYNWEDALVLSSFILRYKPMQIIEIGSGYSTFRMIDINESRFDWNVHISCIEPYPQRLYSRLRGDEKNFSVEEKFVQEVPLDFFERLKEGDILFIDSSHIIKSGGDLPYEYFEILPKLNPGVIIHIHDIFYPFTYPKNWLSIGCCYNEAYLLRALLTNNSNYEILYFNNYMHNELIETIGEDFISGGSIWIRKK